MSRLVLVLGDQLSPRLSSLKAADRQRDTVLMAEVWAEATYVPHHKKKLAFVFSAMRHFAEELRADGWRVLYRRLDETGEASTLSSEVARGLRETGAARVVVTEPGEWRLRQDMAAWSTRLGVPVDCLEDDRFLCSHAEFQAWADGRRQVRMEYFYRDMRRRTGLLMDGDEPAGGRWNFDAENRKRAERDLLMPTPLRVTPDAITRDVLHLVGSRFSGNFGTLEPFWFAVTRHDAEAALDRFIAEALPRFGDFQDAMLEGERFLYHAVISPYINIGHLDPMDVCRKAEAAWRDGAVPLNSAEGFIRQILGWREYVRGIYWLRMPEYVGLNSLGHSRPLPAFYWTGETDMACLRSAIGQTRDEAYAHHIQRLMLTGNFALLAGIDPAAVHEWYLAVYADAYEWVEVPNTIGMSQFADGGLLASKPYASSGAYISRMSDHCRGCHYDVKQRTGDKACPFNALYWDFLARHRTRFEGNPRMAQMYRTMDKMGEVALAETRERAQRLLATIDTL